MKEKLFLIIFISFAFLSGCNDGGDSPSATLTKIQITSDVPDLPDGFTTQLSAVAYYSDNSTVDITYKSLWTSLQPERATVTNGFVFGKSPGTVELTAEYGGLSGSLTLDITDAVVLSMVIDPVQSDVALGETVQYRAIATFSDQNTLNISLDPNITWASYPETVATIDPLTAQANTHAEGSTNITATMTSGVVSNTVNLHVSSKVITTTILTPNTAIVPVGVTQQFTATTTYSDDSEDVVTQSNWTSSNFNNLVSQGSGVFLGIREGNAYVSTSASTNSPWVQVKEIEPRHLNIDVVGDDDNFISGESIQLAISVVFENDSEFDISEFRQVYWQSDDLSLAAVTLDGKVFLRQSGTVNITATSKYFNKSITKQIVID
jgi:uncharacterized protein YjdB